ncbi:MAG: hypothetical protein K0U74_09630 [Alphaproteobacteria bacterium]|nr:hypothetical protein [Alphaproteobacteria bacterium]
MNITLARRICAAAIMAIALAGPSAFPPAVAHDDNVKGKPQHGGQYTMDEFHFGVEMVVTDTAIDFHITEHLEPADMTGSTFKAIVQSDAGTKIIPLKAEGSKLTAALAAPLANGTKVALSGKDADGQTIQARFVKQ